MSNRCSLPAVVTAAALVWLGSVDSAVAAEARPVAAPVPVSDAELAGWVRDLQSDNFKTRRTAMRRLLEAGPQAVDPVAEAAETDDLELASRCIDILKALRASDNVAANLVADAALNKLARSERASVAQRAADAVKKPEPAANNNRFGAVRIQFQVGPAGGIQIGRAVRRQMQRETQVEVDGRKIHIREEPGKEIFIKVTEKVEGKEKTTEYKAKDLDELKKKHPEAAKLYEKYAAGQNNAGVGIGIVQGQIQINGRAQAVPIQVPGIRIVAGGNDGQDAATRKKIEAAEERLTGAVKKLKELAAKGDVKPDQLQKAVAEIEAAVEQLREGRKQLDP